MKPFSICLLAFLSGGVSALSQEQSGEGQRAEWIWVERARRPKVTAHFRREFDIKADVTSAVLRAAGASASAKIYLDGSPLAELDPYDPPLNVDVGGRLRRGRHVLAIESLSCVGPAAVFIQLDMRFSDDTRASVVSDNRWLASKTAVDDWRTVGFRAPDWSPATSFGRVSDRLLTPLDRQVGVKVFDNYEQWRQALGSGTGSDPATFRTAAGFEIDLIRSARPGEDSWVSLAFDPQGRVVIAKEKKGLLRMTLSADGGEVKRVERINDELQECRGLLFAFGDLFVNANNSKGLYRLRGKGEDGFGEPQLLYASAGGVGHGRNDLALGPDGMIYMIHGDSVRLPDELTDHTSPFRRFALQAGEGHLLRIDPAGGKVELLAAGLRNPFGIDFNADGEVFTYDADAEFDMGSPWYRPTRVSHLVTGGDYGWRAVTKSWPPYYTDHADNALPNLDIGKGSPTAVKFGARGNFPTKYQQALFILDWAYGRVLAVHMVPRGASYLMASETFLQGRPLNVTDLDFAADGAMYLVTGGRGTQSALYRVRHVGRRASRGEDVTAQQRAAAAFARQSRDRRRRLEAYLLRPEFSKVVFDEVSLGLADDDPWIRHAARNALERIPVDRWRDRALAEPNQRVAANALLALARGGDKGRRTAILDRLNQLDWSAAAPEKLAALYVYWLCSPNDEGFPAALRTRVAERLNSLYPDASFRANRLLSEMLARLQHPQSIAKTLSLLRSSSAQSEQMHYLFALRQLKRGWTLDQRREYFTTFAETKGYLGGAGMDGFLKRIRQEAVATLTESERKQLASLLDDAPAPAAVAPARPVVRQWTLAALADSLSEVGGRRDLARGEAMFTAASCVNCHRIAGKGTLIGPDLTSVSNRFSRRDLLESIIKPSKVVPEKHRSLQIVTKDGKTYVGQAAIGGDYRSPVLRLAVDPRQPLKLTTIPKSEIDEQRQSPISWMPEGLLDTLSREEILDLLAFIESGGRKRD